jgi:hypothetical protein
MHVSPVTVPGFRLLGRARYSSQQQHSAGARMYALQPISSSVPNRPSGGPSYAIRTSGTSRQAVQVTPGCWV